MMLKDPRLRLLAREVELNTYFGTMVAEDLEEARSSATAMDEQLALLVALVSTGMKTSRLLWSYGQRATDRIGEKEAETLRTRLGLDSDSALAPDRITPLAPVLRMTALTLAEAWHAEDHTLEIDGAHYPLVPIQNAIRDIHTKLEVLEVQSTRTTARSRAE